MLEILTTKLRVPYKNTSRKRSDLTTQLVPLFPASPKTSWYRSCVSSCLAICSQALGPATAKQLLNSNSKAVPAFTWGCRRIDIGKTSWIMLINVDIIWYEHYQETSIFEMEWRLTCIMIYSVVCPHQAKQSLYSVVNDKKHHHILTISRLFHTMLRCVKFYPRWKQAFRGFKSQLWRCRSLSLYSWRVPPRSPSSRWRSAWRFAHICWPIAIPKASKTSRKHRQKPNTMKSYWFDVKTRG